MNIGEKIYKLMSDDALYSYMFDLNDGVIEGEVISSGGVNLMQLYSMEPPYQYDVMSKRTFEVLHMDMLHSPRGGVQNYDCEGLRKHYESGRTSVEADLYYPEKDMYIRQTFFMLPDEEKNSIQVFVLGRDITEDEKSREHVLGDMSKKMIETDNIIAHANIGVWRIYIYDGEKPRMEIGEKMYEIMGLDSSSMMTQEEVYDAWYSRVKRSSLPSVDASVKEMMEKGFSENTYQWNHPTKKDTFVRCGGTAIKTDKGYILRGYHSDVTDIVNAETKHKQLLADALEELKVQKKLLQEALDNYKEADYDRRRDFLTGLRNRQDMFELLQDVLSGKRENIQSMFMMDIDNFKMLNDHYGHTYGDECLQRIGAAFSAYGNMNDIYFYRYGGEEILGIGMKHTKTAAEIANELVKLVFDLGIKRDDMPAGTVTVSLGYTTDNQRYEKMIDKADAAMYAAKEQGKNRAVCFEDM